MRPPSTSSWRKVSDAVFDVVRLANEGDPGPKEPAGIVDFVREYVPEPLKLGSAPARAVPIAPSADSSWPRASASAGDEASAIVSACDRLSDIGIWLVDGAAVEGGGVAVG